MIKQMTNKIPKLPSFSEVSCDDVGSDEIFLDIETGDITVYN